MSIHPSAIIDPSAIIGNNVEIGPYSIIGPHCKVGDGSKLAAHVVLQEYVHMGENCQVSSGAVLGGLPQDMAFKGERSYVTIGNNAIIRECVTINRASGEDKETVLGDGCMLMAYSHLGHNSKVGKEAILANSAQLGGYVEVGDYAFLGGGCVFHQFVRVGTLAIVSGFSGSRQDLPPFSMSFGAPAELFGINKVGLRRRGYDLNARTLIKKAFQLLFFSDLNMTQGIRALESEGWAQEPYIQELLTFVQSSQRGICKRSQSGRRHQTADKADTELLAEIL